MAAERFSENKTSLAVLLYPQILELGPRVPAWKIRFRYRVRFPYMSLGSVVFCLFHPMSIARLEVQASTLDTKHENNSRLIVLTYLWNQWNPISSQIQRYWHSHLSPPLHRMAPLQYCANIVPYKLLGILIISGPALFIPTIPF